RHLRTWAIWNRQSLQIIVEREFFLFQKRDTLLERHREIFARALRQSLGMKAFHHLIAAPERRCARRREKYPRDNPANNRPVKTFVLRQILKNWKTAHPAARELDRTFAKTFLEFIKIDIVPRSRVADDDNRLRLNRASSQRPQIFIVVERRA